jgi:hypothetical protein
MKKPLIVAVALLTVSLLAMGTTRAQQGGIAAAKACLHGTSETTEQATRRREALTATRTINNIQANRPEARSGIYLRQTQLADSPFAVSMKDSTSDLVKRISLDPILDILPGWHLTLDVTDSGYWFMIRDMTDPCGYRFISNQDGVIFTAETLR